MTRYLTICILLVTSSVSAQKLTLYPTIAYGRLGEGDLSSLVLANELNVQMTKTFGTNLKLGFMQTYSLERYLQQVSSINADLLFTFKPIQGKIISFSFVTGGSIRNRVSRYIFYYDNVNKEKSIYKTEASKDRGIVLNIETELKLNPSRKIKIWTGPKYYNKGTEIWELGIGYGIGL